MDYRKFRECYECDAVVEVKFEPKLNRYIHVHHCPFCKKVLELSWIDYNYYCDSEECPKSFQW